MTVCLQGDETEGRFTTYSYSQLKQKENKKKITKQLNKTWVKEITWREFEKNIENKADIYKIKYSTVYAKVSVINFIMVKQNLI